METVAGTEAASSRGGRAGRYRRIGRMALLASSVVAVVIALCTSGPGRAGAGGFVVGCPAGPDSSLGIIHLAGMEVTPGDPNVAPTVVALTFPQLVAALGDPALRNLDTDADTIPDLRWNLELGALDLTQTNFVPLWQRVESALDAANPYTAVRLSFDRLPGDASVAPFRVRGSVVFNLDTPDPNDPDAPPTHDPTAVSLGYDTRPDATIPPTHLDMAVVLQDAPAIAPDTAYLGARLSAQYRVDSDPTGALLAPGTEPPLSTFVQVGSFFPVDDLLDLKIDWDRMPAQFAFVDATTCSGPTPNRTFAWDDRPEQSGVADDTIPQSSADVDLYVGKGLGVAGRPELHLDGRIESIPEEMTARLTETNIRLLHQQHPGNGSVLSSPAPDLTIDELVVTALASGPGDTDTRLNVAGFVHDLPMTTNVDVLHDAAGQFSVADLRFCDSAWGSNECNDTLGTVGEIGLVASDVLPGETTTLPAFSLTDGPLIAYANRDTGGQLITNGEKRFRVAVRMPGVRHVRIGPNVPTANASAVVAYDLAAPVPSARVRVDVDTRHYNFDQNSQTLIAGTKLTLNGTVTPLPARASVVYLSTDAQPFFFAYQLFGAQSVLDGTFSYRGDTSTKLLQLDGRAQLGDSTAGMPSKASISYTAATSPGATERLDYAPGSSTRLRAGFILSNADDRALDRRTRVWGDAMLGAKLVAEWRRSNGSLRQFELRPCATAPCAAGAVFDQASARVIYTKAQFGEMASILSAPELPDIAPASIYPAFTTTPYGVTYVEPAPNLWGARAELAKVLRARYENQGLSIGHKVCLESGALPATVTDKRFGTRVFIGLHKDRKGLPIAPFYLDGVLTSLPSILEARINEDGALENPNNPWLVLNQRCNVGSIPGDTSPIALSGIEYRVLAKFGDVLAHQDMDSDPLGKAAIGLVKPSASTPFGITGRVLSDVVNDRTAGDIAARIEVPSQLLVYRPQLKTCDESTPVSEITTCQTLPMFARDERFSLKLKVLGTIDEYGAGDVLVRVRSRLSRKDPDAPVSPHACITPAGGTTPVCDLDVSGRIDHLPGMVELEASMLTNQRVPGADIRLVAKTLGAQPEFPNLDRIRVRVVDDANPAYVGAGSQKSRTRNYDVDLTSVDRAMDAELVLQLNESLPSHHNVCPDRNYAGRGPTAVEYVHGSINVGSATDLLARTRVDALGRLQAELLTDQAVNGSVYAKVKNVGFGYKEEIPTVFTTSDVDLCIDLDIPFRIDLQNTKVARMGVDLATWVLEVPPNSGQKMTLSFGERIADGTWLPGARWVEHHAFFDPEALGIWEHSAVGRRTMYIMPTTYWNGNEILNFFDIDWDLANTISTGYVFGNDDEPTCCTKDGKTSFTIDLFWSPEIRSELYCRDRPFCHPDAPDRPGFLFFEGIWDRGHLPPTGNLVLGQLTNVTPPSVSGNFSLTASGDWETLDKQTSIYAFSTGTIVEGTDGSRYRVFLGPRKTTTGLEVVVSLGADYTNGLSRWRREVRVYTPSDCMEDTSCNVNGSVTRLPSGLVLLNWQLIVNDGDDWNIVTGSMLVDPSGYAGKPSALPQPLSATAGVATVVQPAFVDPFLTQYETKKVVYIGDGTVVDQGTSTGPAAPVTHTYAFPGTYPGMVVYYAWGDDKWLAMNVVPFEMTVT